MAKVPWLIGGGIVMSILGWFLGKKIASVRWDVAKMYADESERRGFPRYWFPSIAWVESGGTFNPSLVKKTGGDALRGGAYGAAQITVKTARDAGFTGAPEDLLKPEVNVYWMGQILSDPIDRNGKHRPKPTTLLEAATMWNGGAYPGDSDLPSFTSGTYAPAVASAANRVLQRKEIMT